MTEQRWSSSRTMHNIVCQISLFYSQTIWRWKNKIYKTLTVADDEYKMYAEMNTPIVYA